MKNLKKIIAVVNTEFSIKEKIISELEDKLSVLTNESMNK